MPSNSGGPLSPVDDRPIQRKRTPMKAEERWQPTKFAQRDGHLDVGPSVSPGTWVMTRLLAETYERSLGAHARGRLLDLGCGTVPLYGAYRPYVDSITCVDWGGSRHGAEYRDLDHDLNLPLPFGDGSFDTVILSDVLEHIHSPERLLEEIARVLAPHGKLLMNVPFLYWLHEQPHDYYRYTEHGLRRMVERAGLRLLTLETVGGAPEVLADVVGKHVQRLPVLGAALARGLQRAVFAATRPAPVRRALSDSSQRFPLGYFLIAEAPERGPRGTPAPSHG
jgi:SAM-dependent methyltransferase